MCVPALIYLPFGATLKRRRWASKMPACTALCEAACWQAAFDEQLFTMKPARHDAPIQQDSARILLGSNPICVCQSCSRINSCAAFHQHPGRAPRVCWRTFQPVCCFRRAAKVFTSVPSLSDETGQRGPTHQVPACNISVVTEIYWHKRNHCIFTQFAPWKTWNHCWMHERKHFQVFQQQWHV